MAIQLGWTWDFGHPVIYLDMERDIHQQLEQFATKAAEIIMLLKEIKGPFGYLEMSWDYAQSFDRAVADTALSHLSPAEQQLWHHFTQAGAGDQSSLQVLLDADQHEVDALASAISSNLDQIKRELAQLVAEPV